MNNASSSFFKQLILACGVASVVVGCGGGGGGDDYTPPVIGGPQQGTAPVTVSSTAIGDVLTGVGTVNVLQPDNTTVMSRSDLNGFTLYTFDADMPGQSTCVDTGCLTAWPPLLAGPNDQAVAPYTIITRDDGTTLQWAIRDKPLYFFSPDQQPGDTLGEGANNIWRVATVQPVLRNLNPGVDNNPDPDSDYLVSSGSVLTYLRATPGDNSSFVPQRVTTDRLSLYTFDQDTPGMATCDANNGNCLFNWPPLMAGPNVVPTGPYSLVDLVIDNQGNTAKQWALNGQPLYFFVQDMQQGQTLGKDITDWRLARPLPYQEVSAANVGSFLAGVGNVQTLLPINRTADDRGTPPFELVTIGKEDFGVYTFETDDPGVSNCEGNCLAAWPPVLAEAGADPLPPYSLVPVQDPDFPNQMMWAINGKPMYYFFNDTAAMQTNGDNVNGGGYWNVARAAPVRVTANTDMGILLVSAGLQFDLNGNPVDPDNQVQPQGVGFALYTFDPDPVGGPSACLDTGDTPTCLDNWPALYAPDDAQAFGDFTIIPRPASENSVGQWAYKGKPLYYFVGDNVPYVRQDDTIGATPSNGDNGDATGGVINNWTIARP